MVRACPGSLPILFSVITLSQNSHFTTTPFITDLKKVFSSICKTTVTSLKPYDFNSFTTLQVNSSCRSIFLWYYSDVVPTLQVVCNTASLYDRICRHFALSPSKQTTNFFPSLDNAISTGGAAVLIVLTNVPSLL